MREGIIHHEETLAVYGSYATVGQANRALINAVEKGHKIQGRKFTAEQLNEMIVSTADAHKALDTEIEVAIMYGKKIMIRRSRVGDPIYDPSIDNYWLNITRRGK